MTHFSRLTLATLLMGSLALPALAQGVTPQVAPHKDASATTTPASVAPKHAPAMKVTDATGKPGLHKVAASTDAPAAVVKPAPGTTTAVPSTDMKPSTTIVTGKDAVKDGSAKTPTAAPVTKSN